MSYVLAGPDAPDPTHLLTPEQREIIEAYRHDVDQRMRAFVCQLDPIAHPAIVGSAAISVMIEVAANVFVGVQRNGCAKSQDAAEQSILAAFRYVVDRQHDIARRSAS